MQFFPEKEFDKYRSGEWQRLPAEEAPNPVLCIQTRSGVIENVHRGVVCCIQALPNAEYRVIHQAGNIDQLFFPRSAVKYVQILPLLESGCVQHYGFTEEEIAIMCASHNAEPIHLKTVRSILAKAGINESDLNCGGHTPGCEVAAFDYVRQGAVTPFIDHIYNNCSGKHAGFLVLCKYKGFPLDGYLNHEHPIQALIREALSDIFCIPLEELRMGIDGCSAPAPIMSVRHAALGFARLCSPSMHSNVVRRQAISDMIAAITKHPVMVYGADGFDTVLMNKFAGKVIGKRGAAGVFMAGLVDFAVGMAVKIDDGHMGPQYNVSMQLLTWLFSGAKSLISDSGSESLLPELDKRQDICEQGLLVLSEMRRFLETPSFNANKLQLGSMCCIPLQATGGIS